MEVKPLISLYKPISVTPLQLIKKFQEQYPIYKEEKLGYAGRLDPMAEGLILVLVGDENKKRKSYEELPKTYEFQVLFGIETDTYDVLGKIAQSKLEFPFQTLADDLEKRIDFYKGLFEQPYPPYSSKTVSGKPLFYWAREGKLDQIQIPKKMITITNLQLHIVRFVPLKEIIATVSGQIQKVDGNFRQKEILDLWHSFKASQGQTNVPIAAFSISCSSGTYVRSLAHRMGQDIGCGALAYSITRTSIGPYRLEHALDVF